jgi:autophagy-related protein 2
MKEGSIASVRAHIPWPNPLASTVGISLTAAHFIFEVSSLKDGTPRPNVDLAESVASVADSFIHQELSSKEEETLWQSVHLPHPSFSSDQEPSPIPGTLSVSIDSEGSEDASAKVDYDPAGVSVFASLIENLLARFEFDARDIKISLVHADNICVTLSLQEAMYQTDAKSNAPTEVVQGEHRTLSFSGLSLSVIQLDVGPRSLSPLTIHSLDETRRHETGSSRPVSRASSRSSLDEETHLAMSQSLAALPSESPTNSVVSSMYQSALSIAPPILEDTIQEAAPEPLSLPTPISLKAATPSEEQTILSLGSRPVTIVLTTPSPTSTGHAEDSEPRQEPPLEALHATITMNVIACTIKPCHLNGLLRLSRAFSSSSQNPTPRQPSVNKLKLPPLKVTLTTRGFVLLLDPTGPHGTSTSTTDFFEKPLVPPPWDHGYTRVHLETLQISAETSTISQGETVTSKSILDLTVADISIFSFTPTNEESLELKAFPLLITDRYLTSQYSSQHEQPDNEMSRPSLPTFEIPDWTRERFLNGGSKLSLWRTRPPKTEAVCSEPCLQICGCHTAILTGIRKTRSRITHELKINFSPLHVRVDLDRLVRHDGLLSFFDGLLPIESDFGDNQSIYSDDTIEGSPLLWRKSIADDMESPFREPISDQPLPAMTEATQRPDLVRFFY